MTAHVLQKSAAETALARQFAAQEALTPSPRRAAAFARFAQRGLPTRRVESWHYTDLRAAMADAAPPAPEPNEAAIEAARERLVRREQIGAARVVLVNGRYVEELSSGLPAGVAIDVGEPRPAEVEDPLVALNEAMSPRGCAIRVSDGVEIVEPIEIVHVAIGEGAYAVYSRAWIAVGGGARASFFEAFLGAGLAVQRHAATILSIADSARAKHVAMIGDDAGLHVESLICEVAANAQLNAFALVSGGALSRRQIFVSIAGADAQVALGGLTLIDEARRADTTLQVMHSAPGGTSREFYRAIVDDDAVGTFQGKVIVDGAAQKTDGGMKSQAILLSPRAQMNAKPELEIFADDVICGHGATVGSLDPEQIFYLRSRGIAKDEAEAMLLEAFGVEAIERVDDPALASVLSGALRNWLSLEG